jgi:hypothetical protein
MYGFTVNITLPSFLDADRMKTILVAAIGLFIAFAMVSAWMTKKVTKRIMTTGAFVLLTVFTFTQRSSLESCIDKVRNAESTATTCEVWGFHVKIPTDKVPASVSDKTTSVKVSTTPTTG